MRGVVDNVVKLIGVRVVKVEFSGLNVGRVHSEEVKQLSGKDRTLIISLCYSIFSW